MKSMRRSPVARLFAAVLAPWFALVMAEPAALHQCAMHSRHGVTTMASQHATHAHAVPVRAPDPDQTARHCTCLGGCCAAAPVAVPGAVEFSFAPASVRSGRSAQPAEQFAPAAAEHLLPFANGPPAARA